MQIMQRVIGSFDSPPTAPDTSILNDEYKSICEKCVNLIPEERPNAEEVLQQLNTLPLRSL